MKQQDNKYLIYFIDFLLYYNCIHKKVSKKFAKKENKFKQSGEKIIMNYLKNMKNMKSKLQRVFE